MPRHDRRLRDAALKKYGVKLPKGRPFHGERSERVDSGDSGPFLVMLLIYRETGERRGWRLARAAYRLQKRSDLAPDLAEWFEHVDMKADRETVIRRWAKRWNRQTKNWDGVIRGN